MMDVIDIDEFLSEVKIRFSKYPGVGAHLYQCTDCKNRCILITPIPENQIQTTCINGDRRYFAQFREEDESNGRI